MPFHGTSETDISKKKLPCFVVYSQLVITVKAKRLLFDPATIDDNFMSLLEALLWLTAGDFWLKI